MLILNCEFYTSCFVTCALYKFKIEDLSKKIYHLKEKKNNILQLYATSTSRLSADTSVCVCAICNSNRKDRFDFFFLV